MTATRRARTTGRDRLHPQHHRDVRRGSPSTRCLSIVINGVGRLRSATHARSLGTEGRSVPRSTHGVSADNAPLLLAVQSSELFSSLYTANRPRLP
eukprot:scaffold1613_cov75-Phaeocystis_antarctica.AAC.3